MRVRTLRTDYPHYLCPPIAQTLAPTGLPANWPSAHCPDACANWPSRQLAFPPTGLPANWLSDLRVRAAGGTSHTFSARTCTPSRLAWRCKRTFRTHVPLACSVQTVQTASSTNRPPDALAHAQQGTFVGRTRPWIRRCAIPVIIAPPAASLPARAPGAPLETVLV